MEKFDYLIEKGFDVNEGIRLLGDEEGYLETLQDFLDENIEKLEKLEDFMNKEDMPNYAILAHSLKSDSRYLGITDLVEIAYKHELESKENNITFIKEDFENLKAKANRYIKIIKEFLENISVSV